MEMAKYIFSILRTQQMIVFSWGFHYVQALPEEKGLSFLVNGFKFSGRVEVVYNEGKDLFEVNLSNGTKVEDVYLDNLVSVIDGLVEKTADYRDRVVAEYSK